MRILVVDDERAVRESLRRALQLEGYEVELAEDGADALAKLNGGGTPDAVILDVLMPTIDGLEVCRRIRREGNSVPVLMLTARAEVESRVAGLDAGADDYLPKPFALEELLARLRALLRRSGGTDEVLRFEDLELDPSTREARRGGELMELTRTEFNLLELFMRNPRQVLTRSTIFERVWGYDFGFASNSLDVYIGYLRRKTEAGNRPRLIQTVRGVGYALRAAVSFRARMTLLVTGAVAIAIVFASAGLSSSCATSCTRVSTARFATMPERSRCATRTSFETPSTRPDSRAVSGGYSADRLRDGDPARSRAQPVAAPRRRPTRSRSRAARSARSTRAPGPGTRVRILTVRYRYAPVRDPGRAAARRGRPRREPHANILLVGALAGIGLAAILGLLVSGAAIAPIRRLTRATRAGDRDRRPVAAHRGARAGRAQPARHPLQRDARARSRSPRAPSAQLVADASHELRTPLTSLRTNIEVLARDRPLPPGERERLLDDVVEQLGRDDRAHQRAHRARARRAASERARGHAPRPRRRRPPSSVSSATARRSRS